MITIDIQNNYGGKLFCDSFVHVTLYSQEFKQAFHNETEIKIMTRSTVWGTARILALSKFYFRDLQNSVAYLNIGRSAVAQADALNKMYNQGKTLPPDTLLCTLVLGYNQRNIENQNILIKDFWETKQQNNVMS